MQEFDVYRPPGAPDDPSRGVTRGAAGPPVPWDPVGVLQDGWEVVKVYWPVLIFAPFIAGICESGISTILNQLKIEGTAGAMVSLTGMVIQWVLGAFFAGGVTKLFLAAARKREPIFGTIFEGGPWFGTMLGTNFLLGLVGGALAVFGLAPAGVLLVRDLRLDKNPTVDPEALMRRLDHISADFWLAFAAGVVVLIFLSVLITLRLKFAHYYIVDLGHGAIEALGASWRATQGQVLKLFGLAVLEFLLAIGGVMACCVGVFVVAAVVKVAEALIYLHISGRLSAEPAPQA